MTGGNANAVNTPGNELHVDFSNTSHDKHFRGASGEARIGSRGPRGVMASALA